MRAIIRKLDGSYYQSKVFGYFWENIEAAELSDQVYIVLDENKSKLILQPVFSKDNKVLDPFVLIIDSDDSNWILDENGFGAIDYLAEEGILDRIRSGEFPVEIQNRCIAEDADLSDSLEVSIREERHIRDFYAVSGRLHDAYIDNLDCNGESLLVHFDGVWGCQIKMTFSGNLAFHLTSNSDYWYDSIILKDENGWFYLINEQLDELAQLTDEHCWIRAQEVSFQVIPEPINLHSSMPHYSNGREFPAHQKIRLASVQFHSDGESYTYICEDEKIFNGDYVVVPVGPKLTEKLAVIVQTYSAYPEQITFPLEQLKTVLRKHSIFEAEIAQETVLDLLGKEILDLSKKGVSIDTEKEYDLLKTPLGHFWLELNEWVVPMKVFTITGVQETYSVDYGLFIKPSQLPKKTVHSLRLCADFDMEAGRFIDVISDEYVWGNSWELGGIHFGVTAQESATFEDEVVTQPYSRIPFYENWHKEWSDLYGFNLAWKPYESDEDLSIYFYTT